jgi:hypothetical protein
LEAKKRGSPAAQLADDVMVQSVSTDRRHMGRITSLAALLHVRSLQRMGASHSSYASSQACSSVCSMHGPTTCTWRRADATVTQAANNGRAGRRKCMMLIISLRVGNKSECMPGPGGLDPSSAAVSALGVTYLATCPVRASGWMDPRGSGFRPSARR